ncbi:MAG: hypothetical protein NVSMB70_12150 [Chamaesiphon sp.]
MKAIATQVQQVSLAFSPLQQSVQGVIQLAQATSKSYEQAEKLAFSLGLEASQAAKALWVIRELTQVKASSAVQAQHLSQELGITAEQFKHLSEIAKESKESTSGEGGFLGSIVKSIPAIAGVSFAFNQITQSVHLLEAAFRPVYDNLIAQNVELRQQIMGVAAQLAATQDVLVGGVKITDSVEAIKTAIVPVQEQINKLRTDALQLVGVTSSELVATFQVLAQQSGSLGIGLSQAEQLTIKLEAAATTLGLPLQQAQQEIAGIARGEVTVYNQLAKSLNINNERVRSLVAQNKLYDYISQKTEPLVKGQALAAQTFNGVKNTPSLRSMRF